MRLRNSPFPTDLSGPRWADEGGPTFRINSRSQALVIRRGARRAIIAIAHQLLKIVYVMLARREPYRDSMINFAALAAKRNAPRWIRQLKKFGLLPQTA